MHPIFAETGTKRSSELGTAVKFKNFLLRNKPYVIIASVFAVTGILLFARVAIFDNIGSNVVAEVPVSAQVYAAAASTSVPDSFVPSESRTPTVGSTRLPSVIKGELPENLLEVRAVTLTEFLSLVEEPNAVISDAAVNQNLRVAAAAVAPKAGDAAVIYTTTYVDDQLSTIVGAFNEHNANMVANPPTATTVGGVRYPMGAAPAESGGISLSTIILFFAGGAIIFFVGSWIIARRSQAKRTGKGAGSEVDERPSTTFEDIAGCDEAVSELQEIVEFLKDPEKFAAVGAKPRKGALLVGPPGTGKTMLARAVAGESGVPFYAMAGSDFVEMYVGVGAGRVRELFKKAGRHPEGAIVFIDEIDAVGRARSSGGEGRGNQETENTLNALLDVMDGFHKSKVIVLAATNRDDILDKALLRPGRLDRKVHVGLPDRVGRQKILKVHCRNRPIADKVDLELLARRTPGMSGAELEQVVNEACMFAGRAGRREVTDEDFDHSVATIAMGKARTSAVVTEHDRLVTAWHEAGHATIGLVLPDAWDVTSISIVPRGPAGGVTWFAEGDDVFLTRRQAMARIITAMGGRAAEEMLLDGEFTSGPYGDLQQATNIAISMITKFGMTEHGLAHRPDELLSMGSSISDATWAKADAILAEGLDVARNILATHREMFDALVAGLLEYETLTSVQIEEIRAGKPVSPPDLPKAPHDYSKVHSPAPAPQQGVKPTSPWSDVVDGWMFPGRKKRRVASAITAAVYGWNHPFGQGNRQGSR